jgi:LuxR family maltose regulon positive regulatory protein
LIQRLDDGLASGCKLTLISAPAGFGKTTLVTEWLESVDRPCAWLSLDEADNDRARFFAYLVAALQRIDPGIGQSAQAILRSPQPPAPEVLLIGLINDIATTPMPFTLVLDDYHLIHTLSIHQQLAFLIDHQPPNIHLVIATREDPPLPHLSRLRARGQAADIRQSDLRFTAEEADDFLRRTSQLELSSSQVTALHRRTEGWVAGLQLAALSLRGRDDVQRLVRSFTGSQRYILDYLIEEVFQKQPAGVQDFLLKTSILDRFTAPLCDVVVQRDDSREVLLALDQANLFIVSLDESRSWYRYHRLFADLLRHRLDIETEQVATLHQRASRWYADNSLPADAVRHSLAASDWERAAALILSISTIMLQRGQVTTLLGWFRALPDELVRAHPRLCVEYSWPLILTEQIDSAESFLFRVEQAVQGDKSLLGEIAAAQAYIARARDDTQRVGELSERALALLPQDDLSGRSVVALNLGIAQWHTGRLVQAERALKEAQRAAQGAGNDYVVMTAIVVLGRIQAVRGNLRRSAQLFQQVIEQGGGLPIIALAHISLAELYYEWNDLESATDCMQQGLELSQRSGGMEFQITAYLALAQLKQAQGKDSAAQEALQTGWQLIEQSSLSPSARLHGRTSRVLIALAEGDLDEAAHWAEGFPRGEDVETVPDRLHLMLAQARLLLAQDEPAAAAEQLEAREAMASRAGWESALVQTRALQALAASTLDEALAFLSEALTTAEPEGYVRTFVDLGEPMTQLLREAAARGIAVQYVRALLAAVQVSYSESMQVAHASLRWQPLIAPLSERELQVLGLLVEGQTYQEIAQALYISINTVKTHLKNIYGKLGVHNRRQAVGRAKELDLLP